MLDAVLRALPLAAFVPFRHAVLKLRRNNPVRLGSVLILKRAEAAFCKTLSGRLTEIRPLDIPHLAFEPSDSMVLDSVYWFGIRGYEGTVPRIWATLCAQAACVLEVGGNIGFFSVVGGSKAAGRYTVVEPVPRNCAALRANLVKNGLTRVELLQAAVIPGAEQQDVQLNIPSEDREMPVGAHLTIGSEVSGRSSLEVLTVTGLPFADLVRGRDLVKIDAEGLEYVLLKSAEQHILDTRPTLVIEVLPESRQLAALLAEIAARAGYSIYVLPEYGSDDIVNIAPHAFTSDVPARHHAKDVVLSMLPLA